MNELSDSNSKSRENEEDSQIFNEENLSKCEPELCQNFEQIQQNSGLYVDSSECVGSLQTKNSKEKRIHNEE